MSSQAHADRLAKMLSGTGLCQPVHTSFAENQVNVMLRIHPGCEMRWTELIERLLRASEASLGEPHVWKGHFCKHYFLKDTNSGKSMVFGWNISVSSQLMSDSLDAISRTIKSPNRVSVPGRVGRTVELTEIQMTGVFHDRNVPNASGKGVYTIGGSQDFKPQFSGGRGVTR